MSMSIGLPQVLIAEILFRLPVKSLLRFQCVSKTWVALINDPTFINIHLENNRSERNLIVQTGEVDWNVGGKDRRLNLNYYLVNFSDQPVKVFPPFYQPLFRLQYISSVTKIIGCCNGLVCIHGGKYNKTLIWNPSIRKCKKLPFEPTVHAGRPLEKAFAFGYDPVNNDYKVLWIGEEFEVKLYSLNAHSWRRVEDQWPYKDSKTFSNPVYLKGAFYWLVKSTAAGGIRLLAFNLTDEKFQKHALPVPDEVEPLSFKSLKALGGSLLVSKYGRETQPFLKLWIMTESGWSPLCTLDYPFRQLVSFSTDGQKVLMELADGLLYWYDIKKKSYDNALTPIIPIGNKSWTGICETSLLLLDGDNVD
ncbi:F-box/kelch-repeat protein At3g06240-like [Corylus avellana]|uniref:F-box/kelch-repeat protein At3g06240-like n=1 Tax=Corylus avellana TaxID=13451 RepID=UPI00286A7C38|nr:F-box/kelch-repeat protein At3g06240-like [Corylus avellana]